MDQQIPDAVQQAERPKAWVIADTETTGLNGPAIEIALHEINPLTLEMLWEVDSLIDPGPDFPIEPGAMAIHGITDEMVADAPTLEEFLTTPGDQFLNGRLEGRDVILICHNAVFDIKRLHPIGDVTNTICTLFHSRQLVGTEVVNHKLTTLREHFGFPPNEAHRALADVYTTKRLLRELLGRTNRTLPEFLATMDVTVHRMPWGKHRGQLIMNMRKDYLEWVKGLPDLEPNLKKSVVKALKTMAK